MLDERKLMLIDEIVKGEATKTEIARIVGVSRQTVYDWLDDPKVAEKVDERLQALKGFAEKKLETKIDMALDNLIVLANDNSNKRVQAQVNMYLIDRALGKPTSKVDIEAGMKNSPNTDIDLLESEFAEFDEI